MNLNKIEKLLRRCNQPELKAIEEMLQELSDDPDSTNPDDNQHSKRKSRRDKRFETNLFGSLLRITDVKPGERKEFSAIIKDISRSGLKLAVEGNFVPSRIVSVTFAGPGGKTKRYFLEVVRMRKMANQNGCWLEIGCRSISVEKVRRLQLKEEKLAKMRSRLHRKKEILIAAAGKLDDNAEKIIARIKAKGYGICHLKTVREAMWNAKQLSAQLVLFLQGSNLLEHEELLAEIKTNTARAATLAIVDSDEHRLPLLQTGVDECLVIKDKIQPDYIFHLIERALVGHAARNPDSQSATAEALVVSRDNIKNNLITFRLEEYGYVCKIVSEMAEALKFSEDEIDLVMLDFDSFTTVELQQLVLHFPSIIVLAMCNDMGSGHQAMVHGATNYLCMPPKKDDMDIIMKNLITNSSFCPV
jgi:DNA-binding NarL/FixJ family response regulator